MKTKNLVGQGTRKIIESLGYPSGDNYSLEDSSQEFDAGGNYGIEISSVNNPGILENLLQMADSYSLKIDRIDECRGIFRLPDDEIRTMVDICKERQIGLIMSVGPRAIYDNGAFSRSKNGVRIGYRLRGMESIVYAIEDVKRASELGVRGFLIYDEGLLQILNHMRQETGQFLNSVFKLSVHAGCSNPLSAKLFTDIGADSINVTPDLDLPMLAAIRQTIDCPLDLFSDTAADAGGLIRTYEVPEFIRVASPVYVKCGPISQICQNHLPTKDELKERVKQVRRVVETIDTYYPDAKRVSPKEKTLGIPQ